MLLAVDIGNTNISCAVFQEKKIMHRFALPISSYSSARIISAIGKLPVSAVILCSVVPRLTRTLKTDLRRTLGCKPYIIGKDALVPIKNRYRNPKEVGQDRLVNAYAASQLYGIPVVVMDFGTAITVDVVSEKGEYLGGMILPGLQLSLDALRQKTALLPKIKLGQPEEFIGRDTRSSMLSGIVYGFASLTDRLINQLREEVIGKEVRVIGTGGDIGLISGYCEELDRVDWNLTLKGLSLIYRLQKKS